MIKIDKDGKVSSHAIKRSAIPFQTQSTQPGEQSTSGPSHQESDNQYLERQESGRLIAAEEIERGRVAWPAFRLFLRSLGGKHPILFCATIPLIILFTDLLNTFQVWYLGYWGSQYEKHPINDIPIVL